MKTNIANDFLVYVIEEYKFLEQKTPREVVELFSKYNVFDYILQHYEALHTMGGRAIADDVNLFIERRADNTCL
jgi:hypothetical protein